MGIVDTGTRRLARFGADGLRDLDLFIQRAGIEIAAIDAEQAHVARQAFSQFGKGRPGSPATS